MADNAAITTGNPALAKLVYRGKLISQLYFREPMLGALFDEKAATGDLRPDSWGLMGGSNLPRAERARLLGGYSDNIYWQNSTGAANQTENMTATDTYPSMTTPATNAQAFLRKSAFFKWTKKVTQCLYWNVTAALSAGQYAITDVKRQTSDVGMQNHFDSIADEIYVGVPADQSADVWSAQSGINETCDDDNVYGGVDRALAANVGWRGRRYTTSTSASLNLKNTLEITTIGSYANSPLDISTGFDLIVWNKLAYNSVRQQAEIRGQVQTTGEMPKFKMVGSKMEGFIKDGAFNTYSPRMKNWLGLVDSAQPDLSAAALFTRMGDWLLLTNPAIGVFKETPYVNLAYYGLGASDAQQSFIESGYQWRNHMAANSFLATAVS